MGAQIPSVGRIVHFVHGGTHYAAIIVHVWSETCVNLAVLPNGVTNIVPGCRTQEGLCTSVSYADAGNNAEYSWHWPEYVG